MAHLHNIIDTDKRFYINPITREIKNESGKFKLMQNDNNAERFGFEIPRLVECHDVTLCDKVEIHYINIGDGTKKSEDVYPVDDIQVSPTSNDTVVFTWLISANATKYAGSLNFLIRFVCLDGDKETYAWHTDIFKDIMVGEGMNNSAAVIEESKDILEAWKRDLLVVEADDFGLEQDPETGYVYPVYNGVRSSNGIPLAATGGGGGGGGTVVSYNITLKNTMESRSFSITEGAVAKLNFEYSSVDADGEDDGDGVGTIYVGNVRMATINVKQGDNEIDVSKYLVLGANTVKIKVENTEGLAKAITYTIDVVTLTISTTFDLFTVCNGEKTFYYTPYGTGDKTMHFLMDGNELPGSPVVVSSTGKGQSFVIPAQSHGAHIFEVYAEMTSGGVSMTSDKLTLCLLSVGGTTPMLGYIFNKEEATEGETISIPYFAYHPLYESAEVVLSVIDENGEVYSTKTETVGRSQQTWSEQDYPAGNIIFRLAVGDEVVDIPVAVADGDTRIQTVTDGLVFKFDAIGKSNNVENPAQWSNGNVSATFSGVGFIGKTDGWVDDDDGNKMLRLLPGGRVTIPFKLFETDKRDNGVTVEVEMATHNVRDYDSVVMSCSSSGRGFRIASQYAQLHSEQSEISMQFKEDERVRVSFVVEPKNLNRMIYVYVDGIICGAIQYPTDDNFAQNPAVGITIGAQSSGIDVYRIYLYDKGLTRGEILGNYIADRPTLAERVKAFERNDVLNVAEEIVISKLPPALPYMVISCAELPQYKGDKKTCDITYVDPGNSARSFTAYGVEIDVQGTSSVDYWKKNFVYTLMNGLTYTKTGQTAEKYALRDTSIPVSTFCMKADVASSEGANNVELVRLYNDTCPYKTEAQQADSRVRVGIDGLPCVVFWQNSETKETKFWGKYNFNNDKSTPEVFGLGEGCESWEIRNNISDRVIFKISDYGAGWEEDFEARYPKKNADYTNLKRLTDWIVSTDRSAVSTDEEKAARLEKFKSEFDDYFVKTPTLFYYLFTEVFLMVDNRAKNFFPTTYDGTHWMPLPYDFDTAIGINNEGKLAFGYSLEDTDTVDGDNVYNGQESVLWCNVRDAFADEIKEMYSTLRSGTLFNYDTVVKRFKEHQDVWCESVWNEDAYEKYIAPLVLDNDKSYLTMLQGNKASQREWWLYNGFRYRDSKYQCGDAEKNKITLRCYANGDITVTPYSDIYPRLKYGTHVEIERGARNVPTTLSCPSGANLNDTETNIYSADRLIDVGDLSPLQVGYANFTAATKLQRLKIGDGAEGYQNTKMAELHVGNNDLLSELDIRNCVKLEQTIDLSACDSLEIVYAKGSAIKGVTLPNGGKVKTLELPSTLTNLTIINQKQLRTLTLEGVDKITTLRIENTPNVPLETILNGAPLERVRLINVAMTFENAEGIKRAMACGGLDANGGNTEKSVITGTVHFTEITPGDLADIEAAYPELDVTYDTILSPVVMLVEGTIKGTYKNELVTNVGKYAFYDRDKLSGIDLPNALAIGSSAFTNCYVIKTANLPKVTSIGELAFSQAHLEEITAPNVTEIGRRAFGQSYLKAFDAENLVKFDSQAMFSSPLKKLILRCDDVCICATNSFESTPISRGEGYIYVHNDRVEDYKSASGWSSYANQIRPIYALEDEQ